MAFSTFFINGNTLAEATSVFTDAALTTLAADAYYSDGSIVRQQVGGVLLSIEACPACSDSCPNTVTVSNQGLGLYKFTVGVTSGAGAILVRIDVDSLADGFRVNYDGTFYNQMSSTVSGYLGTGASTTEPIYIGNNTDTGCQPAIGPPGLVPIPCPAPCTTFQNMTTYEYDFTNNVWIAVGTSNWVINASEVQTQAVNPGPATLVIPKINAAPNFIEVEVYGPCNNTGWTVEVDCPVALSEINTSGRSTVDSVTACADTTNTKLYNAPVNGTPGVPGLHDWIYLDSLGTTLLSPPSNTFFKYLDGGVNKFFEVSTDSIIVNLGNC